VGQQTLGLASKIFLLHLVKLNKQERLSLVSLSSLVFLFWIKAGAYLNGATNTRLG